VQTADASGGPWTTRATFTGDQDYVCQWQKINPPITARYVRFYAVNNYGNSTIQVREFTVGTEV
jgi:hypothetical protein